MRTERTGAAASRTISRMDQRLFAVALAAALAVPGLSRAQVVEPRVDAPGSFDALVVNGAGQVRLFQAERDEVVVPGDRRLLDGVHVQRTGTTLTIALPRDPAVLGALAQVEVHVNHLTRLTLADASSVTAPLSFRSDLLTIHMASTGLVAFENLLVGQLVVDLSGAAQGRLVGRVDKLRLSATGTSQFAADHLRARIAEVSVADAAGADVWPVNEGDLRVSGSGRVRYWGTPKIASTITGQGSIAPQGTR